MEKLLKLLNEYQKELNDKEGNKRNYEMYERELRGGNIRMNDLDDPYEGLNMYGGYAKARLISKSFGFIKRLVDSDKIGEFSRKDVRYPYYLEDGLLLQGYGESNSLIMLLSISDNPIEDLISYLN